MSTRAETLRELLYSEPMTARQLIEKIGISLPTLSRAIRELSDDIVKIGAGPSIQYALRDAFRGFRSAPIYRVTYEEKSNLSAS